MKYTLHTSPRTTATRSRQLYPNYWDILALLLVFSLITLFAWDARQMATPYPLKYSIPISLSPIALMNDASRTIVRMLIALCCSLIFTFIFGTWAAKSDRAERIIIPVIDILQSVPILGFLSITIVGFIHLFPGSLMGPECAAIFAIFTSQAWNMALGFYQTVRSVPYEINEAARMFHLSAWQHFWRIDVPFSMPGLLWNMMVSMSGGWFFVVASEAITVANQQILLPGMGSYIAVAIQEANLRAIIYAILMMLIVILLYDQLLFRPLVAWAEKFKFTQVGAEKSPESWVIDLFRRARIMRHIGKGMTYLFDLFVDATAFWFSRSLSFIEPYVSKNKRYWDQFYSLTWNLLFIVLVLSLYYFFLADMLRAFSLSELEHVFFLGAITALRVMAVILLASLLWVPIGVWIGQHVHATQIIQPIAQFLAAFPANLFYPFVVLWIIRYHLNVNIWLTPLMILGSQWYILFNVIAGASTISKDWLQVADNLGVSGWLRWSQLLLPGIFPYYVTGAMTAAGGAWNASIVSEVASWGKQKLIATGLGAYISEHTTAGHFPKIALGIGMMCFWVLIFNYMIWRPLYRYAENKFLYR